MDEGAKIAKTKPRALPADLSALLSEADLRSALGGIGERSFKSLLAEGVIPPPLELRPRVSRWTRQDLESIVERLPRRSRLPEPPTLAEGRRAHIARLKGLDDTSAPARSA